MILAEPITRSGARQNWWKVLLALSLALNLFFVVGALWISAACAATDAVA